MATEVESRLRSRCASMEEKQLRDKEQIQVALYDIMKQIIKYTVDIVFVFCFSVCYLYKLCYFPTGSRASRRQAAE